MYGRDAILNLVWRATHVPLKGARIILTVTTTYYSCSSIAGALVLVRAATGTSLERYLVWYSCTVTVSGQKTQTPNKGTSTKF